MNNNSERLQRLTELARKAWPDAQYPLRVHVGVATACVFQSPWGDTGPDVTRLSVSHAEAADALETALCVLAGEPLAIHLNAEVQLALNDRMARRAMDAQARAEAAEAALVGWTEATRDMAKRWRDCEDAADAMQGNPLTVNDCAGELLDALGGEP